jgi:hypothetical protein
MAAASESDEEEHWPPWLERIVREDAGIYDDVEVLEEGGVWPGVVLGLLLCSPTEQQQQQGHSRTPHSPRRHAGAAGRADAVRGARVCFACQRASKGSHRVGVLSAITRECHRRHRTTSPQAIRLPEPMHAARGNKAGECRMVTIRKDSAVLIACEQGGRGA